MSAESQERRPSEEPHTGTEVSDAAHELKKEEQALENIMPEIRAFVGRKDWRRTDPAGLERLVARFEHESGTHWRDNEIVTELLFIASWFVVPSGIDEKGTDHVQLPFARLRELVRAYDATR